MEIILHALFPFCGVPPTNPFISINNLTKRFDGKTILNDVSLRVKKGQTVCLLGPSGGGKSTLLRCVNGLNTFDTGNITIGTHQLQANQSGALDAVRRTVGMVFQDFRLFPHMTALENVMEAPCRVLNTHAKEARQRAEQLLSDVGLADRMQHWPHQLSGGQQQRVAIARALAMNPEALLCDEITSALDPERKHDVLDVLEKLQHRGLTILMVTHEMGFARKAADHVVILADGKNIEEGSPAEVIDRPQHERTKQFFAKVLG
ncbi:MAG: amino acid ABC transporter ATP-binding protein [Planctomycetia bacterium]|nr:amino acid ABC transporter ATP-binding protein [Planctomycetia bacterium]